MYVPPGGSGKLAPGQFERIAKALADPRRFAFLETIAAAENECAYGALCDRFPVTKATVSHHVKELVQAGLVISEREGQYVHTYLRPGVIEAYAEELVRRAGGGGPCMDRSAESDSSSELDAAQGEGGEPVGEKDRFQGEAIG